VDTNHKTFTVIYSEGFFDDLENIPAKNALSILDGIDRLECFPEMGKETINPKWKGYRYLIIKDFVIFYTIDFIRKTVNVEFAKHGKMEMFNQ